MNRNKHLILSIKDLAYQHRDVGMCHNLEEVQKMTYKAPGCSSPTEMQSYVQTHTSMGYVQIIVQCVVRTCPSTVLNHYRMPRHVNTLMHGAMFCGTSMFDRACWKGSM